METKMPTKYSLIRLKNLTLSQVKSILKCVVYQKHHDIITISIDILKYTLIKNFNFELTNWNYYMDDATVYRGKIIGERRFNR